MAENNVQDKRGAFGRENSIEVKGLKNHLEELKEAHKGRGYKYFVDMVEDGQNRPAIGKAFGVDYRTAGKWITIYRKEQRDRDNKE